MMTEAELKILRERDDRWSGTKLLVLAAATLTLALTVILSFAK